MGQLRDATDPVLQLLSMAALGLMLSVEPGCATSPSIPAKPAPSSQLIASERLGPPMLLRQRLSGEHRGKPFELECVLQISQGKLTIIGMTPFGSRAFVLTQTGVSHTFTKLIDRELPFDPLHILEDVHRVFFRGISSTATDGKLVEVEGPEQVKEQRSQGVLKERSFVRLDQNPPGEIKISYGGPKAPLVPTYVTIDNGWYGYRLEIETVVQESLP